MFLSVLLGLGKKVSLERIGSYPPLRQAVRLTGIGTPSIYIGLTISIHLLNPDIDWLKYTISYLALGRYGWIEIVSVYILGLCVLAVAFGLYYFTQLKIGMKVAIGLLVITGLAFMMTGGFRTSEPGVVTTGTIVHRGAVVTIALAFPTACFLMLPTLKYDTRWRNLTIYCAVTGMIALLLDIVAIIVPHQVQQDIAGLWERGCMANGIIWCQVIGTRLFLVSRVAYKTYLKQTLDI